MVYITYLLMRRSKQAWHSIYKAVIFAEVALHPLSLVSSYKGNIAKDQDIFSHILMFASHAQQTVRCLLIRKKDSQYKVNILLAYIFPSDLFSIRPVRKGDLRYISNGKLCLFWFFGQLGTSWIHFRRRATEKNVPIRLACRQVYGHSLNEWLMRKGQTYHGHHLPWAGAGPRGYMKAGCANQTRQVSNQHLPWPLLQFLAWIPARLLPSWWTVIYMMKQTLPSPGYF